MKVPFIAFGLAVFTLSSSAANNEPVAFSHNDWELACDNTRTCRAAGYQSESGTSAPVSMLITRAAGPATTIEVKVQIGGEDGVKGLVRLRVGKVMVSGLGSDAILDAGQIRAVLPALLSADEAVLTGEGKHWTLSLAGLNAVLLKMDEAQGRIGTPGALVRRGNKPESSVLAPVPPPVFVAIKLPKARVGDDALASRIFSSLDLHDAKEQCNNGEGLQPDSFKVSRLSGKKVLLSFACSMGAYNSSSLLWIANDKPPYAPVSIEANGDFDEKDASVTSSMKGRGVGDCWSSETWHFNGKAFVRTAAQGDGMCRGFAGGAWGLPRYVSRLVPAPAATPSLP